MYPPRPPDPDTGRPAPTDFEGAAIIIATEMIALLVERHQKYGPANIARHRERGVIVRMGDKLSRLEHLYGIAPICEHCGKTLTAASVEPPADGDFSDESVEDAWLDGGNYPLVALMLRRGWWNLPLLDQTTRPPQSRAMHRLGEIRTPPPAHAEGEPVPMPTEAVHPLEPYASPGTWARTLGMAAIPFLVLWAIILAVWLL